MQNKLPFIITMSEFLALFDIFLGEHGLLYSFGWVTDANKNIIFSVLALIILFTIIMSLISTILDRVKNRRQSFFVTILLWIAIIVTIAGFMWDIITSLTGFYSLLLPAVEANGKISSSAIAFLLALVGTTSLFFSTMVVGPILANYQRMTSKELIQRYRDKMSSSKGFKIFTVVLFFVGFIFDFYTSYKGNAFLLGLDLESEFKFSVMFILAWCTLFVCFCQYFMLLLYENQFSPEAIVSSKSGSDEDKTPFADII